MRPVTSAARASLAPLLVLVGGLVAIAGPGVEAAHAAGATEVTSFGSNPGALKMFRYVPAGLPAGAPMVVAMHGCTQSAAAYDEEPGWVAMADRMKFALVLPEQQLSNNSNRCFNWFQSSDITRDSGEALSVKQMVDQTKIDLGSNPARTFVTGLSAGGAMTSVMLADYPDVFAGGAIMAGLPFRCATTVSAALSCMDPGVDRTPAAWGDLVRSAATYSGTRPTVQIWHGTSDSTVRPMNMTELVDQWTNAAGADQTADLQDTVAGFPHSVYRDAGGRDAVELYSLTGMNHGTPVDPGTGAAQCGIAGAYILDVNICSSYYIARSWGLDSGDQTAPTVNVTAPTSGATVTGAVTVSADASDAVGVTRVELYVDGTLIAADTTAPYTASWSSAGVADGSHHVIAKAYDAASNVATDDDTIVTASNGSSGAGSATLTSRSTDDGYVKAHPDGSSASVGLYESSYGLAVGRGTDGDVNKTVLSFDTAPVPDGAVVTAAEVTVTYNDSWADPWASPPDNKLVMDVKSGCFGLCTTEAGDWSAAATAGAVADIAKFTSGTKSSGGFNAAGLSAVNKAGLTQVRLAFAASPTSTAYLFLKSSATATLHLTWQ